MQPHSHAAAPPGTTRRGARTITLVANPKDAGKAAPGSTRPDAGRPESRGWFREFLLRLHFYAGILAGPFLLVAALTGGFYAITPQLERAVHAKELRVPAVTQPQPLSAQVQAAMDAVGGASPVAVRPAPGPEDTTRVLFADPSLGSSENRTIFVDPGTTEIRGDLTTYRSSGALPMRTWISNLHRSLNLGEPGRIYSELAASWLWAVALGGLVLWIGRLRRRGNTAKKARPASGRQRTLRLHGTTGTVLLAGFLFLSASGLTWSANAGNNINAARASLGWLTPTVSTSLTGEPTGPAGDHSGHGTGPAPEAGAADPALYDTVQRLAREDIITARMVAIKPPATPGTAWTVAEISREWPPTASTVAIDPAAEKITSRADFADFGLAAKLTSWAIAAHMGLLFGIANQLVLLAVACGLAAMVIWGYMMWWKRRPTRGSNWAGGPPAPRGAFLRGNWAGILITITVMVLLGLALPLLGWSLLGFILLDTAIGEVKRCRTRTATYTT